MNDPVNHAASVINRFFKYTKQSDSCWEWVGSKDVRGYGQLNDRGKVLKAHRLAYEIHNGKIPQGLLICHRCNNKSCVNPSHLYAGSHADNWKDAINSGAARTIPPMPGEKSPSAKLTLSQVKFIRASKESCRSLGRKFNVSSTAISFIKRGKTWKI